MRRLVIPQAFLAADAIALLVSDVVGGLEVFPKVVERRLAAELPFLATETLLMEAVKAGGDRQQLHEAIRSQSQEVWRRMREDGASNDLLERLRADALFGSVRDVFPRLADPQRFVGRAAEQVDEFLAEEAEPELARHARLADGWRPLPTSDDTEVRV